MDLNGEARLTIVDLPWEDVLFPNIFYAFTMKDFFNLRSVSKSHRRVVDYYFSLLKQLHVTNEIFRNPDAFNVFSTNCRALTSLVLYKCKSKPGNNTNFVNFAFNNDYLTEFIAEDCPYVKIKPMIDFIVNCKNLRILNISGCKTITGREINAITEHLLFLENVDFSSCDSIDEDALVRFIFKFGVLLKDLSLAYIPNITEKVILAITENCENLEYLNLSGFNGTVGSVKDLMKYCIKIEALIFDTSMLIKEKDSYVLHIKKRHRLTL